MYEPHTIMAIDPGKATGVALWRPTKGFRSYIWEEGLMGFAHEFGQFIYNYGVDTIVIEKFTIGNQTKGKTAQYDALYINGLVLGVPDLMWTDIPYYRVIQQTASQAKSFAPDSKLKTLEWYKPGAGHDNDAARHLLTFMAKLPAGQEVLRRLL